MDQARRHGTSELRQAANTVYLDAGMARFHLAQSADSLWHTQPSRERRKLRDILLLNWTFDGENLYPDYRKPFCWLAEGLACSDWLPLLDELRNWLTAEECRELGAAV